MKENVLLNMLQSVRQFKKDRVLQSTIDNVAPLVYRTAIPFTNHPARLLTIVNAQHLWKGNVERKSLQSEKLLQRNKIGKLRRKYVVKSPRRNVRMFRGSNVQSGMSRFAGLLPSRCAEKFTIKKFAKMRLLKCVVPFLKNTAKMLSKSSAIRLMLMIVTLSRDQSATMFLKLLKGRYKMKSVRMSL